MLLLLALVLDYPFVISVLCYFLRLFYQDSIVRVVSRFPCKSRDHHFVEVILLQTSYVAVLSYVAWVKDSIHYHRYLSSSSRCCNVMSAECSIGTGSSAEGGGGNDLLV